MDSLIIADQCRRQLTALLADCPHALLLLGPIGIGKYTVATAWARQLTMPQNISSITPDEKGSISIDVIRTLYQRTRNKQDGHQVVIIDHAEAMGIEAQNAFLKLLEEPRTGVTFILTAPNQDALLPTISSRVQSVTVPRVSQKALQPLVAKSNLSQQELAQLLFVADGRPAVIAALLNNPAAFDHYKQLMQQAKQLLSATPYERLVQITNLAKNKDDAMRLLEAMARMLHIQLLRDPNDRWLQLADDIQVALARLAQNGNARAQLTALFAAH